MSGFRAPKILPSPPTLNKKENSVTRFEKAFQYLLPNEGGLTDNPHDPGGITKYGIILADLPKGSTADDIRNLTVIRAEEIYRAKYWNHVRGDDYDSDAKGIAIMDTAVNKGLGGCKGILHDALGVSFTGEAWEYRDDLIAAVNARDLGQFLSKLRAAIMNHINARIAANPDLETFRKGWTNRAERLLTLTKQ